MANLKFCGGVDEIGGNRILVGDRVTRILLDYGMSFSKCGEFFEEYLKPRFACTGIKDLLFLKLLPYIGGIAAAISNTSSPRCSHEGRKPGAVASSKKKSCT